MSWRYPLHERRDDQRVDDDMVRLLCTCGWASEPVPTAGWDLPGTDRRTAEAARAAAWAEHYLSLITPSPFQLLTLTRDDSGGWRHHLAGEPLHSCSPLELLLPDGAWWPGRYETTWPANSAQVGPTAMFHGPLGGPWLDNDTATRVIVCFALPADAVLRHAPREDGW